MKKEAKMQIRLPLELRDWLAEYASAQSRSMNGQISAILREVREAVTRQGAASVQE